MALEIEEMSLVVNSFNPSASRISVKYWLKGLAALVSRRIGAEEAVVMVMPSDPVAVCIGLLASLTRAIKLNVPAAVGVPVMAPLEELSARPVGRDPLAMDQV